MGGIKAVLFDMGGVIVQLDSLENVLGPSTLNPDEIWNGWWNAPVSGARRG